MGGRTERNSNCVSTIGSCVSLRGAYVCEGGKGERGREGGREREGVGGREKEIKGERGISG